jgi:hypothetical protein
MFSQLFLLVSLLSSLCVGKRLVARGASRERRRFRPWLEALEARQLLSYYTWVGGADNNWSTPANWTVAATPVAAGKAAVVPPGPNDSVIFDNRSVGNPVLDTKAATVSIQSLTLNNVPQGMTLDLKVANLKITGDPTPPADMPNGGLMNSGTVLSSTNKTLELSDQAGGSLQFFLWKGGAIGNSKGASTTTIQIDPDTELTIGTRGHSALVAVFDCYYQRRSGKC